MIKKSLTETDVCRIYIAPAIEKAGWEEVQEQIRKYHPSFRNNRKEYRN